MADWTFERIAELSIEQVKSLRANALKRTENAVVELCDAEMARRKPAREKPSTMKVLSNHKIVKLLSGFILFVTEEKVLRLTLMEAFGPELGSSTKFMLIRASVSGLMLLCMRQRLSHLIFKGSLKDGAKPHATQNMLKVGPRESNLASI